MSDLQMWDLVIGFLSATFVLPVLQQPHWTSRARALLTFAWSILCGAGVTYLGGAFSHLGGAGGRAVVSSVLLTLVAAVGSYKGFAKPTGIAPAIEAATSRSTLLIHK